MKKILFYDCEIARCIPSKDGYIKYPRRYEYCAGWHDKANMGIACVGTYASWKGYDIFLADNLKEFESLASESDEIVGFNSIEFDEQLLAANGIIVHTTFDLLCETRVAAGMPPHYVPGKTRGGYSLEQLSQANLGQGKTSSGMLAPKLWQDGLFKEVFEYCLNDVDLLRKLYSLRSEMSDPTNGTLLFLRGGNRFRWATKNYEQIKRKLI